MSIVVLLGPPGSGKSTQAQIFVHKHPEFVPCSVDQYIYRGRKVTPANVYKKSKEAWQTIRDICRQKKNVIIESSGSHLFRCFILEDQEIRKKHGWPFLIQLRGPNIDFHLKRSAGRKKQLVDASLTIDRTDSLVPESFWRFLITRSIINLRGFTPNLVLPIKEKTREQIAEEIEQWFFQSAL
jgi:hypothetical protein